MGETSSVQRDTRIIEVTLGEWGELVEAVSNLQHAVGLLRAKQLTDRQLMAEWLRIVSVRDPKLGHDLPW